MGCISSLKKTPLFPSLPISSLFVSCFFPGGYSLTVPLLPTSRRFPLASVIRITSQLLTSRRFPKGLPTSPCSPPVPNHFSLHWQWPEFISPSRCLQLLFPLQECFSLGSLLSLLWNIPLGELADEKRIQSPLGQPDTLRSDLHPDPNC